MLIPCVGDRFVNQGLDVSESLLPLLSSFEFELMVLKHTRDDLVFAFGDVEAPPVLSGSKLGNDRA